MPAHDVPPKYKVDHRIDNMGYWKRMAVLGLVPVAPSKVIPGAVYKSSKITDATVATSDSPDIPVTTVNSTQSENSVFVHPNDRLTVINSNNSSPNPYPGYFFGADDFFSFDGGESWDGQVHGAGSNNMGDPSTAINSNGRWFVGYIHSGGGQAVSYSDDGGQTWKIRAIASPPPGIGTMLDKSHLWIDNSVTSPYKGYLYDAWTTIGGPNDGEIEISRSMDNGLAWQMPKKISDSTHARSHNQGVNIATGPNGEVYTCWAVYDNFPGDETALGFARSTNGGQHWEPARRIIDSIRGIRLHGVNKLMRTNSFPSMAVDNSNSPWRGTIYIVWANVNVPGINSGKGVDVYMIRSADGGDNWSEPLRINQDTPVPGKQHFLPWICCDPANGNLSVIFYDDRDTPPEQTETWVATSTNGGYDWQDFRVSDVAFTPSPVTGLSDNYFGDYLGITANSGLVYPCWTDNRSGVAMTYVSPFRLGPPPGQAFIAYQSNQYNDTLTGNANGRPDYGENALLGLQLRNMGDRPDSNVFVTLKSDSPYIRFTDSTENFGNFDVAQSRSIMNAFAFHISDSIPNGNRVMFTVTATDSHDSIFTSNFTMKVFAPEVTISRIRVNDSATNNSHSFDPGETAFLVVKLANNSQFEATNLVCSLGSAQSFVHITQSPVEIGNLLPGHLKEAVFRVKVDSVPAGTIAAFNCILSYSGHTASRLFNEKIGLIFEDWESDNFKKFDWTFGGNAKWVPDSIWQYEGNYCVKSGGIGINQSSSFSVNYRVLTYDSISFYRKVSSEENYDMLNFYINDTIVGQWSGELDWERVSFPVVAGIHNFKWEYTKDPAVSVGLDAAFIDFIEFPSIQFTTADAGKDVTIYECQDYTCFGVATLYDSLRWSTTGTGVFTDPRKIRTKYSLSDADKAAGSVTLILTVYGTSANEIAIDSVNVTILPKPTAFAGPDTGICTGESFRVSTASAANYKSLYWTTTGNGVFDRRDTLFPLYMPGRADTASGKVNLILVSIAGNNDACGFAVDTLTLFIYKLTVVQLPVKYNRCAGYSATLDATTPGASSYEWMPGGQTTASIVVDTAGIGIGSRALSVRVTDEHGCKSTISAEVNFTDCHDKFQAGNVFFRVYPNPGKGDIFAEFFASVKEKVTIKLVNSAGKTIFESAEFEIEGQYIKQLDFSKIAPGTYLFSVKNAGNTVSQKLIIL